MIRIPRMLVIAVAFLPVLSAGPLDALLSATPAGPLVGRALAQGVLSAKEDASGDSKAEYAALAEDTRPKKPLTLMDAVKTALANNLSVAISEKSYQSTTYDVVSQEALFDPNLGANTAYRQSTQEASDTGFPAQTTNTGEFGASLNQTLHEGLTYNVGWDSLRRAGGYNVFYFNNQPVIFSSPTTYGSALALTLRQPLLRNFGSSVNTTGIEIARIGVSTSSEQFRATLIDTLSNVQGAYWDLKAAISSLKVQQEGLKLANDLLNLNKKKVEVGTLAPIQITEAEASVASREQGVIIAAASIRNAEDNLRRIMNIPPTSPDWEVAIDPTDRPPFEPIEVDREALIKTALDQRPELIAARNQVKSADLSYRYSSNQVKPQLDALGGFTPSGDNFVVGDPPKYGNLGDSVQEVFQNHNYNWSLGLQFSIPIGNRAAKAKAAQSRIAVEQAQLSTEDLERNIAVQVRTAVLAVETFKKSVAAARVNVGLQRKKVDAEQKRYDNGMSTSFQVLTFQNDLTTALDQEISSILAYVKSVIALGRVTATLPEQSGVTLASPAAPDMAR